MEAAEKWLLIITSASMFILCDALSANWIKNNNPNSLTIMFGVAPIAYILFGILNKKETLSVSSGLVNVAIVIGAMLIGVFVFHDNLAPRQVVGLTMAIVAVILMS